MFSWLKRNHYFIIYTLEAVKEKNMDPKVLKYIRRYFFWRGYKVNYFEPAVSHDKMKTYLVFGTAKQTNKINRQALIFILEFFASIKDPMISISTDFLPTKVIIEGIELEIYKIPKNGNYKNN